MPPQNQNTPPTPEPIPAPAVQTPPPTLTPVTPTPTPVVAPAQTVVQTTTPPVVTPVAPAGLPTWAIPTGALIVVLLLLGFMWFTGILSALTGPTEEVATPTPEEQAAARQPVNDLPTASNNTSDDAILEDSAAIDAQIQGLSSDSASVDQSFNDQPVEQEY